MGLFMNHFITNNTAHTNFKRNQSFRWSHKSDCRFCHALAPMIITEIHVDFKRNDHWEQLTLSKIRKQRSVSFPQWSQRRRKWQQNGMCAQRRLRSAWAAAQSDQSSPCAQWVAKDPAFFKRTAKTLIRLGRCLGWSESSLGAHAILLALSYAGSCINYI